MVGANGAGRRPRTGSPTPSSKAAPPWSRASPFCCDGALLLQTDAAVFQVYDAEQGTPLWPEAKTIGNPTLFTFPAAMNGIFLAVVNGTHLYILSRPSGESLWDTALEHAPAMAPALSNQRLYLPVEHGMMTSFQLKPPADPLKEVGRTAAKPTGMLSAGQPEPLSEELRLAEQFHTPVFCQSIGQVTAPPVVLGANETDEAAAWPTREGYMVVGQSIPSSPTTSPSTTAWKPARVVGGPGLPSGAGLAGDAGLRPVVHRGQQRPRVCHRR